MGDDFQFKPATKRKQKLRMAIAGPTGSGKTFTALRIARGLVGPAGRIALIDTEHESASLYEDVTPFETLDLRPPYSTERYQAAMAAAARQGFDALIIDSMTHAWSAEGGILDQKDKMNTRDKFAAWQTLTPKQNALIEAILSWPGHLIATMRSKMEYAIVEENGRKRIDKLGLAPVQRDDVQYEFTLVMEMDLSHTGHIGKTRCSALDQADIRKPGEDVAATLLAWLDSGAAAAPKPDTLVNMLTPDALAAWVGRYVEKARASKRWPSFKAEVRRRALELDCSELVDDWLGLGPVPPNGAEHDHAARPQDDPDGSESDEEMHDRHALDPNR